MLSSLPLTCVDGVVPLVHEMTRGPQEAMAHRHNRAAIASERDMGSMAAKKLRPALARVKRMGLSFAHTYTDRRGKGVQAHHSSAT